jgi:cell division protein ZapB
MPCKGAGMEGELFTTLENRIESLLSEYADLKRDRARLEEENSRFRREREELKSRIDTIIGKIEAV